MLYHERKTNNFISIGSDLEKKKTFKGIAGDDSLDQMRNSRFYNDSKKCLWLMGGSKIGIFTIKKMTNKAIPGFFGKDENGNLPIGCVYNRETNWLAGVSNQNGISHFHIYKKGQNIQHMKLRDISQGKFSIKNKPSNHFSGTVQLCGSHPRQRPYFTRRQ